MCHLLNDRLKSKVTLADRAQTQNWMKIDRQQTVRMTIPSVVFVCTFLIIAHMWIYNRFNPLERAAHLLFSVVGNLQVHCQQLVYKVVDVVVAAVAVCRRNACDLFEICKRLIKRILWRLYEHDLVSLLFFFLHFYSFQIFSSVVSSFKINKTYFLLFAFRLQRDRTLRRQIVYLLLH